MFKMDNILGECEKCQCKAKIEFSWETDSGDRNIQLCKTCADIWKERYRYMMDVVKTKELLEI